MGIRRKARELALQALYQMEITGNLSPAGPDLFWDHFESSSGAREFAERLIAGVVEHRDVIDPLIERAAEHWKLGRMPRVDLTILRVATYELLFCPDIPMNVSIDEAIEVAKRYGSEESPTFINGVLDQVSHANDVKESEHSRP
jgi:transcription antitermination protein NusB